MCPAIPVANSQDIEAVKEAYKLMQAQLIEACEIHAEFVEWWQRNNKVGD